MPRDQEVTPMYTLPSKVGLTFCPVPHPISHCTLDPRRGPEPTCAPAPFPSFAAHRVLGADQADTQMINGTRNQI